MKYSEKEIAARKQVAIAAVSYYASQGDIHVTLSLSTVTANMTVYGETMEEVLEYERQSSTFILDGTSRQIREIPISDNETFYSLNIDWLP